MEIVELLPLEKSELRNRPCDVLARVLAGKTPAVGALIAAPELVERLAAAGYPEAIRRTSWTGRQKWFQDCIRAVLEREVREISKIEYIRRMPWLLRVLAAHSRQRVNDSSAAPLGLGQWTTQKYTDVAQRLDCVRTLHPWYTNDLKRLVKRPTLHCLDSALLAAPRNLSPARLNCDRMVFGALLETFVRGERLTLARWNSEPIDFWGPL